MSDPTLTFYQNNANEFSKSTINVDLSSIYEEFEPHLPNPSKILDVGCGAGRDLKYFSEKGFSAVGIDASSKLVEIAKQHSGCAVHQMMFEQINWINEFDGIWCCASLLHIPYSALSRVFKLLEQALVDRGAMYVSFKYGEHQGERNGRYFCDLNEARLKDLVDTVGKLGIQKTWITGDARPGREDEKWLNAILIKRT